MYVGIAILLDEYAGGISKKMTYELDGKYGTGLEFAYLMQHVSLKHSFPYEGELVELEDYFRETFSAVQPFSVLIERLEAISADGKAIVWMKVRESAQLRGLHERLCDGLSERFGIAPLGFDGQQWQFHSTIAISDISDEAMKQIIAQYHNRELQLEFTAREAVMFCSMNMNPEAFLCFEPKKFNIGR